MGPGHDKVQGVVYSHIHNYKIHLPCKSIDSSNKAVPCPFLKVATWCTIPWVHVFLPGPAKSLFEKPYFEKMKAALRPGGIISSMGK